MRAIGRVSYSWYLWHWPVLLLAPALLGHPLGLVGRLTAAAISAGLAVGTLRLIENPIRFAAPLRRSALRSLAVGGVATAVAVCVGIALLIVVPAPVGRSLAAQTLTITHGPPLVGRNHRPVQRGRATRLRPSAGRRRRLRRPRRRTVKPRPAARRRGSRSKKRIFFNGCLRNYGEVGQPECAMGDTASTTTVALVGDSNAMMWTPGFQQVATQRHWRLESLAMGGCPLLDLPIFSFVLRRDYTECKQWRAEIIARLQTEHPN